MAVTLIKQTNLYIGASTDTKPSGISVKTGSKFYEYNTGKWYITYNDGTNWIEISDDTINANLQINGTDVSASNKVHVSDSDMLNYSFATGKSQKQKGAGTITPVAGTTFYKIQFHDSTTINAMTVVSGWADYTGDTMPAGSSFVTNCTSIEIAAGGFITAYQRST